MVLGSSTINSSGNVVDERRHHDPPLFGRFLFIFNRRIQLSVAEMSMKQH